MVDRSSISEDLDSTPSTPLGAPCRTPHPARHRHRRAPHLGPHCPVQINGTRLFWPPPQRPAFPTAPPRTPAHLRSLPHPYGAPLSLGHPCPHQPSVRYNDLWSGSTPGLAPPPGLARRRRTTDDPPSSALVPRRTNPCNPGLASLHSEGDCCMCQLRPVCSLPVYCMRCLLLCTVILKLRFFQKKKKKI